MQRIYAYRRKLPHYQWTDKTYFITFNTKDREILTPHSRTLVLETCIAGNGKKYELHAAVIMQDFWQADFSLSVVERRQE